MNGDNTSDDEPTVVRWHPAPQKSLPAAAPCAAQSVSAQTPPQDLGNVLPTKLWFDMLRGISITSAAYTTEEQSGQARRKIWCGRDLKDSLVSADGTLKVKRPWWGEKPTVYKLTQVTGHHKKSEKKIAAFDIYRHHHSDAEGDCEGAKEIEVELSPNGQLFKMATLNQFGNSDGTIHAHTHITSIYELATSLLLMREITDFSKEKNLQAAQTEAPKFIFSQHNRVLRKDPNGQTFIYALPANHAFAQEKPLSTQQKLLLTTLHKSYVDSKKWCSDQRQTSLPKICGKKPETLKTLKETFGEFTPQAQQQIKSSYNMHEQEQSGFCC